jgi:hypothetical protein
VKRLIVAAVVSALAAPALAQDNRTLAISPEEAMAWEQVPALMDQCIGALVVRRDAGMCQAVVPFLERFAAKVKAATAPAPVPPPNDPPK